MMDCDYVDETERQRIGWITIRLLEQMASLVIDRGA